MQIVLDCMISGYLIRTSKINGSIDFATVDSSLGFCATFALNFIIGFFVDALATSIRVNFNDRFTGTVGKQQTTILTNAASAFFSAHKTQAAGSHSG